MTVKYWECGLRGMWCRVVWYMVPIFRILPPYSDDIVYQTVRRHIPTPRRLAQGVTLLTRILKVPISKLGRDTVYTDSVFVVLVSSSWQNPWQCLKLDRNLFPPHPIEFIIHHHPVIRPRRLTTLWAFTACNRHSFISIIWLIMIAVTELLLDLHLSYDSYKLYLVFCSSVISPQIVSTWSVKTEKHPSCTKNGANIGSI
jgi:hypothetical protein